MRRLVHVNGTLESGVVRSTATDVVVVPQPFSL